MPGQPGTGTEPGVQTGSSASHGPVISIIEDDPGFANSINSIVERRGISAARYPGGANGPDEAWDEIVSVTEFRGYHTNLSRMRPSRKRPRLGDLFNLRMHSDFYLVGRVVRDDAKWALGEDASANLVYVYDYRLDEPGNVATSELTIDRLLVAPFFSTSRWWSRGYFETFGNVPISAGEVLQRHAFWDSFRKKCFDEYGEAVRDAEPPIGDYSLPNIAAIDTELSIALDITPVDYSKYVNS